MLEKTTKLSMRVDETQKDEQTVKIIQKADQAHRNETEESEKPELLDNLKFRMFTEDL